MLSKLIYQNAGYANPDWPATDSEYLADLQFFNLQDLFRLIQLIWVIQPSPNLMEGRHARGAIDISKAHDQLVVAHEMLVDWPMGFHKHLAHIQANYRPKDSDIRTVQECFGSLFARIYRGPRTFEVNFVRLAFEDYLTRCWDGLPHWRKNWVNRKQNGTQNWLTVSQAVIEMNGLISRERLTKLVLEGVIKGISQKKCAKNRSMIWIERASLAKWMKEVDQWISIANAMNILGISRESIEALGHSGTVRYTTEMIPENTCGLKFSRDDIERISTKFESSDVPILPYSPGGELIAFRHVVKDLIGTEQRLTTVVEAVISGKLKPHGRAGKFKGIQDYLFLKSEIVRSQSVSNGDADKEFIFAPDASRLLETHANVLNALVREGFLSVADEFKGWVSQIFSLNDVLAFHARYVSVSCLAKQEKTSPGFINRCLMHHGIPFIRVYPSLGNQTLFFDRNRLEAAELFKSN